mgnify:CR=1 FL=1|jgi:uncharacterized protein YggE
MLSVKPIWSSILSYWKSFGLCAFLAFPVFANPLPSKPHVYVEGSAAIEVVPDTITFKVSLEKVDDDISVAKADIDLRSRKLINILKNLGVLEKNIAATTLRVNPETDYVDGKRIKVGVMASRQIQITIKNIESYPNIMAALIDAKVSEIISTHLSVSNEKELEDSVLSEAMNDAKTRASRLAKTQGKKLGEPYSISEFMTRGEERYMLQISRRVEGQGSANVSALAFDMPSQPSEPFSIGTMVARAEVYVVYLLSDK